MKPLIVFSFLVISCMHFKSYGQSIEDKNPEEEFVINSRQINDSIFIRVSLPIGYHDSVNKNYPVIFHPDADVSYGLITQVRKWLELTKEINPVIVVGIAYKKDWRQKRARDLSPFISDDSVRRRNFPLEGKAHNFVLFIKDELTPRLRKYRIDWNNKTITGHSLGGLFANFVLLTSPSLFDNYLVIAPAAGLQNNYILSLPRHELERHQKPIKVFTAIGLLEAGRAVGGWNEINTSLKNKYPRVSWADKAYENHGHFSVVPVAFTDGLKLLIGK